VNVALALLKTKKTVVVAEIRSRAGTVAAQLGASSSLNTELLLRYEHPGEINPQTLSRFLTNHPTGLRLLLAPPDMDEQREITDQQVEAIVNGLAGMVDYVVLDVPAYSAKVAKAALRCCQFVALVVELESTCLASAPAMLKALDSWGVGGPLTGVVLVQRILDASAMTVGYVRSHLACPIVGVIPPAPDLCAQALRSGSPLVLSHPDSICAAALGELAGRLAAEHVSALTF
jgi:pilus assembly protein CpaE